MSITNTDFNNKLTLNKPYDEEVWHEETTSKDIEDASNVEREYEDSYDASFTNLMINNFPHLKNPNYISSPDSDTKTKNDIFTFHPPTPPKNISKSSLDSLEYSCENISNLNIGDGNFDYIKDNSERIMLENAWQAITQTNTWDFVVQDNLSFMWSKDTQIDIISEKMEELGYNQHSGCSFACTMRNMQYLAKNGVDKFKQVFNGNDIEVEEVNSDIEANPYEPEGAIDYEQRLKKLIKITKETGYYEKRDKEARKKKLLEYMGGF